MDPVWLRKQCTLRPKSHQNGRFSHLVLPVPKVLKGCAPARVAFGHPRGCGFPQVQGLAQDQNPPHSTTTQWTVQRVRCMTGACTAAGNAGIPYPHGVCSTQPAPESDHMGMHGATGMATRPPRGPVALPFSTFLAFLSKSGRIYYGF